MGIIEQAALRLEALNRAGLSQPAGEPQQAAGGGGIPEVPRLSRIRQHEHGVGKETQGKPRIQVELDLDRLQRLGHLVPTQTRTLLAQEFRHIKRPLLRNVQCKAAAERSSLIMVTSALPGEGKTFCAINLALSIAAEVDSSVLLVDADVVHPEVMDRLGLDARKGLLDLLTDERLTLDDVVMRTNVPKLSILAAGKPNDASTELLASSMMDELLERLVAAGHGRVVIFDAPPLLVTTEAAVLASHVGQVVMVVEASRTPLAAAQQAFAALEQSPIVMSVLNKGRHPVAADGYGYYQYGSGA
jgi:exopolysaccharide/PEP-CTERM locus tyrosine autokinase